MTDNDRQRRMIGSFSTAAGLLFIKSFCFHGPLCRIWLIIPCLFSAQCHN